MRGASDFLDFSRDFTDILDFTDIRDFTDIHDFRDIRDLSLNVLDVRAIFLDFSRDFTDTRDFTDIRDLSLGVPGFRCQTGFVT